MKAHILSTTVVLVLALSAISGQVIATQQDDCGPNDHYVVPAAATILVEEDLFITSECNVVIQGILLGAPGSAANITIQAGGDVDIIGQVIAGTGQQGTAAQTDDEPAIGGHGANGGHVNLIFTPSECTDPLLCRAGTLIVHATGIVRGGDGGDGGKATANLSPAMFGAEGPHAVGGDGGDAGGVTVSGHPSSVLILGQFHAGSAGDGGKANAWGPGAHAIGGAGGDAAPVVVPGIGADAWTALQQQSMAGNGGPASATSVNAIVGITGAPGDPDGDTCDPAAFIASLVQGVVLLVDNSNPGNQQNLDATAQGGDGGNGILYGGKGGTAEALGCANPDSGTPGQAGDDYKSYQCYPIAQDCSSNDERVCGPVEYGFIVCIHRATAGGEGGTGPNGGAGSATGGNGGNGLIAGGVGGYADAEGGKGGRGGIGGKGGDTGICEGDAARGGDGGKGGDGGLSTATGGRGGDALLAIGQGGTGGFPNGVSGPGGAGGAGGDGGKPAPFQAGIGYGNLSLGCNPSPGAPGSPGDTGDSPTRHHKPGEDGDAGDMTPEEAVRYLLGNDTYDYIMELIDGAIETAEQCRDDVYRWLGEHQLLSASLNSGIGPNPAFVASIDCYETLESIGDIATECTDRENAFCELLLACLEGEESSKCSDIYEEADSLAAAASACTAEAIGGHVDRGPSTANGILVYDLCRYVIGFDPMPFVDAVVGIVVYASHVVCDLTGGGSITTSAPNEASDICIPDADLSWVDEWVEFIVKTTYEATELVCNLVGSGSVTQSQDSSEKICIPDPDVDEWLAFVGDVVVTVNEAVCEAVGGDGSDWETEGRAVVQLCIPDTDPGINLLEIVRDVINSIYVDDPCEGGTRDCVDLPPYGDLLPDNLLTMVYLLVAIVLEAVENAGGEIELPEIT